MTQTTTTATGIIPEHLLHHIICAAYTEACDRYAEGGSFMEAAHAASDYFKAQIPADEYEPTPQLIAMFEHFFMGFIQGFALGEHQAKRELPEARPIPQPIRDAVWKRETEAAARLAGQTGDARFQDCDCATIVYNANREKHPGMPFEFHIASVYFAGVERGREKERARLRSESYRKAKKNRPAAVTGE